MGCQRQILFIASVLFIPTNAQFSVTRTDKFDEINTLFRRINGDNCMIKPKTDLFLDDDTVSHKPDIKEVNVNPIYPNRTALLNIHNMAYSRAFFFSYILQSRMNRPSGKRGFEYDPGFMYYFLSAAADIASNPKLNASALYFSPNMAYTSSYRGFFNKTLPLFAPRAFRMDDYNDPVHLKRESTMNFIQIDDLGAIPLEGMRSQNYTRDDYRINEWYATWLPHINRNQQDAIRTFDVKIRFGNNTNYTVTFHGPRAPDETPGPVKFSRPYFDCGRSDKWLVPAASPVADIYPRHTQFRHIEFPTYTAVAVMEMDFERIDINQCPKGEGNSGPNMFADTANCKKETTKCEPLDGYGFRRGGYQCRCNLRHRLPNSVRRPYLGEIIERATYYQLENNFDCVPVQLTHKYPLQYDIMDPDSASTYLSKIHFNVTGPESTRVPARNPDAFIDFTKLVTASNCRRFKKEDLRLRNDVAFGKELQYDNEARMALRLANFISSFSQIVYEKDIFSGFRVVDRPLNEDQMMGEVLSILFGNSRVWSAGMYWDRNKFTNRTLFAPVAYKTELNSRKFSLEDMARLNSSNEVYTNKPWFRRMKRRWSTNFEDLEKYYIKLKLRQNADGVYPIRYEHYPTFYRAADIRHGEWQGPEFDCRGPVKKWLIWYSAPFFGWDSLRAKLEFKGVIRVAMDLEKLDINQCPGSEFEHNAFKDSHKCDRKTSYCVPIQGREFITGGYKCECIQGFEYQYNDAFTYFDGQLVEAEFSNIVNEKASRYDYLKCRLASAQKVGASFFAVVLLLLVARIFVGSR